MAGPGCNDAVAGDDLRGKYSKSGSFDLSTEVMLVGLEQVSLPPLALRRNY